MTSTAKLAEKRRRKRLNRKARDRERTAEEEEAAKVEAGRERAADQEHRRQGLVKPNVALRDSGFMDGLLDQMRAKKVGPGAERSGIGDACERDGHGSDSNRDDSSSSDGEAVARVLRSAGNASGTDGK